MGRSTAAPGVETPGLVVVPQVETSRLECVLQYDGSRLLTVGQDIEVREPGSYPGDEFGRGDAPVGPHARPRLRDAQRTLQAQVAPVQLKPRGVLDKRCHGGGQRHQTGVGEQREALRGGHRTQFAYHLGTAREGLTTGELLRSHPEVRGVLSEFARAGIVGTGQGLGRQQHGVAAPVHREPGFVALLLAGLRFDGGTDYGQRSGQNTLRSVVLRTVESAQLLCGLRGSHHAAEVRDDLDQFGAHGAQPLGLRPPFDLGTVVAGDRRLLDVQMVDDPRLDRPGPQR